ncbi:MAG: SH3 domain-containing protein [Bacilli bacterium]|nr:SH3 domain-containing protein [Bacilli bacterium]
MALVQGSREESIKDDDELTLNATLAFDKKSSTYSDEIELTSFISENFKSIENNLTSYNYFIKLANNYLATNNEITTAGISSIEGDSSGDGLYEAASEDIGTSSSGSSSEYASEGTTESSSPSDPYEGREPEGDAPDEPNAIVITQGSRLNIRSGPGTNNKIIAKLKNNTKVVVLEKGDKWSYIAYNDSNGKEQYGYVSNDYLQSLVAPEDPTGETIAATPTYTIGTVNTNGGRLNVRSGPGTSTKVLGKLKNNAKINIVEQGKTWTKIVATDKNGNQIYGYVATKYISA